MKKSEFVKVMKAVSGIWPMFVAEEDTLDVWWSLFKDRDFEKTLAAVMALAKDPQQKFPPHPGAIIGFAEKSFESEAEAVWQKILVRPPTRHGDVSATAFRAFIAWGGARRWGLLPDVRRCGELTPHLARTLEVAKREFVQMFVQMKREREVHGLDGPLMTTNGTALQLGDKK